MKLKVKNQLTVTRIAILGTKKHLDVEI
jgi:hypothetical protein